MIRAFGLGLSIGAGTATGLIVLGVVYRLLVGF